MDINDNFKNRADLKSYFVKNAIPTESNFAQLIESGINQRDDGLVKMPGTPLCIEASGDASSQKKAINFYSNFVDDKPEWVLSLNPRVDPVDPNTSRTGLSISDAEGNSRLFIDKVSGKIGIHNLNPEDTVDVHGNLRLLSDSNPIRFTSAWSNFPATGIERAEISNDTGNYKTLMIIGNRSQNAAVRRVSIWDRLEVNGNLALNGSGKLIMGEQTRQMIDLWRSNYGIGVQSGTQYFRTDKNFAWYKGGSHDNNELNPGGGTVQMILKDNNLGIGLTAPLKQLHIQQGAIGAPLLNEARRPGIALTGQYPELNLFSRVANPNHGPTVRLGSYNADTGTETKHWVMGTAGQNSRFLDLGFSNNNSGNPHCGIRNYSGTTVMSMLENGRVGVGVLEPQAKLHVEGDIKTKILHFSGVAANSNQPHNHYGIYQAPGNWQHPYPDLVINYHTGIQYVGYFNYGGHRFYTGYEQSGTPTTEAFSVGNGDHNTRVNYNLYVAQNMYVGGKHVIATDGRWVGTPGDRIRSTTGDHVLVMQTDRNLVIYSAGRAVWASNTSLSDENLKKDYLPISNATEKLLTIKNISYSWKDKHYGSQREYGVLAQDIEKVFPELVSSLDGKFKGVNYRGLIPVIIESIKEQTHKITSIESSVKAISKYSELTNNYSPKMSGADFAEYFQSVDNTDLENGLSVVLEDGKVRPAKSGEHPIGVVSANPSLVGGSYIEWPGKYLRDDFGEVVMEEYEEEILIPKKEKIIITKQKSNKKEVEVDVVQTNLIEKDGKVVANETKQKVQQVLDEPVFEEVDVFDEDGITPVKHQVPVMEEVEEEVEVKDEFGNSVFVGSGEFEKKIRPKINPEYDPDKKYTPRMQRPEWNVIGLLGLIPLRKGQPVANSWIKMKDISSKVELWLVK